MSDVATSSEFQRFDDYLDKLKVIVERIPKDRWLRFVRGVFKLGESKINEFKNGMLHDDDLFDLIQAYISIDPGLLWRHRTKFKKANIRRRIEQNRCRVPEGDWIADAIYDLVDGIPMKDRVKFCREELHSNPSPLRNFPVCMKLKEEMLDVWCREIARGDSAIVEATLLKAEDFLKENEGCEDKSPEVNCNILIGCSNVTINQSM